MTAVNDEPDTMAGYPLGTSSAESARLQRQSDQLRPHSAALLHQLDLKPGQSVIDLGCGPSGILDLLSAAVAPTGRVVGVDANPYLIAQARDYADRAGLDNVEVLVADARHTGLPADSFDLVHARTLLATLPDPAEVVAEMVRLARPGGWVAGQEPDVECAICYPRLPAWDRLRQIFRAGFDRLGADLLIGRRLTELYRQAGLQDIQVVVHAGAYPADHSRRTILPDLVSSLRPVVLEFGLSDEAELADLDQAVRQHLADPGTLVMSELMVVVWASKPATARRA
ncbi:MAG TPA: methyltransferase domain-containing protein [Pseudonocardiaceae bacterium]|jgi:SAM-dependent methyltransferase